MCLSIVDELNLDFTSDTHTLFLSVCGGGGGEGDFLVAGMNVADSKTSEHLRCKRLKC